MSSGYLVEIPNNIFSLIINAYASPAIPGTVAMLKAEPALLHVGSYAANNANAHAIKLYCPSVALHCRIVAPSCR